MTEPPSRSVLPPELDPRRPRPDRRPGPAPGRRRPRRRAARILSWIAVGVSLTIVVASSGLYVAFRHYTGRLDSISGVLGLNGHEKPPASGNAVNFLLVGSDTRNSQTNAELAAEHTTDDGHGALSDTMILLHIPKDGSKATLVSFPRDSWVQIPAWTNPKTGRTVPAHKAKLNSSFSEGGLPGGNPALTIATIEDLSGLRIDHYVQIDFPGFRKMVSALGGVDICTPVPLHDSYSGVNLTAGRHHLTGDQALAFVRQRHGLPRGDIDRIAHQQQFIGSIVRRTLSAGTLLNPIKLKNFLDVATSAVHVDDKLTGQDLLDLGLRMRHLDAQHVIFATVPVSDISAYRDRQSVVLLDQAALPSFFGNLSGATPAGEPSSGPAQALIVPPSQVSVQVFNGAGTRGLAARATRDLTGVGFAATVGGNDGTGASATTVYYSSGKADSARTLAAAIPGAKLQRDDTLGSRLKLVVGSSYAGAKTVTVGKAPASGGSSSPSSASGTGEAPKTTTAAADACSG